MSFLPIALLLSLVQAPAQDADPAARFWNQSRGNPAGNGAVDVEPLPVDPEERWRTSFESIVAGPVVWGEVLFLVEGDGRTSTLHALDLTTGERLAGARLGRTEVLGIAAWQGTAVVVDAETVRTYPHKGSSLKMRRKIRGEFAGEPVVVAGQALVPAAGGGAHLLHLYTGEFLDSTRRGEGRPTFDVGQLAQTSIESQPGYEGEYLTVHLTHVDGLGTEDAKFTRTQPVQSGQVAGNSGGAPFVVGFRGDWGIDVWFARGRRPLRTGGGQGLLPAALVNLGKLSPIQDPPVFWEQSIVGFSAEGTLVRQNADGGYVKVVEENDMPAGARARSRTSRTGRSISRDVACSGACPTSSPSAR